MKLSRVGVDLAKNVYQLHGVDRHGKTVWKRRLRRGQWLQALLDKAEPGCEIGMEALHRRSSLGPRASVSRLHGTVDCAAVRQALRQEQQERCQRC